jgi:hypothetical protein
MPVKFVCIDTNSCASDIHTVLAPSGHLNLTFGPANKLHAIGSNSPLAGELEPGWRLIKVDDVEVSSTECHCQVAAKLQSKEGQKRVLIFKKLEGAHEDDQDVISQALSSKASITKSREMRNHTVLAPAGRLGVVFSHISTLHEVTADSPLAGQISKGWELLSIDGFDVSKSTCHCQVAAKLRAVQDQPRVLVFGEPLDALPIGNDGGVVMHRHLMASDNRI